MLRPFMMVLPVLQKGDPPRKAARPFLRILRGMAILVRGSVLRLAYIGAVEQMFGRIEQVGGAG